jgi:predicted O-methyltransferase YrrM
MTAIDDAHCDLIFGLVRAFKPKSILELGWGTGASTKAVCRALLDNGCFRSESPAQLPYYALIDNWKDFGGVPQRLVFDDYPIAVTASEERFVKETNLKFDFILCDGDHTKTNEYWLTIYRELLSSPGIVCFHDVSNPDYPNLLEIGLGVERQILFNTNSTPGERCDRGLLVLFK